MTDTQINPNPTQPPKFRDAEGREWTVRLTLGLVNSVQDETGANLLPKGCDVTNLTDLLFDPEHLSRVLWSVVRRSANDEVTWESFRDGFDGESLLMGWNALVESVIFFIQSLNPPLAKTISAAIEASMRMVKSRSDAVCQAMEGPEIEAQNMEHIRGQIAQTLGGSAGS